MSKSKYLLYTRSTTVLTRSPGPLRNFDNVIIHLLLHTYSQLQQKQSHKIDCIITVQTFYYSYTENTADFLNIYKHKACHSVPLSSNSVQETRGSCFTWSVISPLCLRALGSSQVSWSWVWGAVQKKTKKNSSSDCGWGKSMMGQKKSNSSQTGLPKRPPALHDPCSGGPVTVVCQFNQVGGEAIVCQLVLPVKSICNEIIVS